MSKVWTRLCFVLDLCATTTSLKHTWFANDKICNHSPILFSPSYLTTNHQFTLKITLKYNYILTSIASIKSVLKVWALKKIQLAGQDRHCSYYRKLQCSRLHLSILIELYSYFWLNKIHNKSIRKIFCLLEKIVNINYTTLHYRNGKRLLNKIVLKKNWTSLLWFLEIKL